MMGAVPAREKSIQDGRILAMIILRDGPTEWSAFGMAGS